jgi:hypothetical protein
MKAVQIEKTGGTDVLQYKTDVPLPELKDGEVLVKNEFIGTSQYLSKTEQHANELLQESTTSTRELPVPHT